MRLRTIAATLLLSATTVFAQQAEPPLYKDATAGIDARASDLLGRMTLEEKFWQLFMIPGDLDDAGAAGFEGRNLHDIEVMANEPTVVNLVNVIIATALRERASDILLKGRLQPQVRPVRQQQPAAGTLAEDPAPSREQQAQIDQADLAGAQGEPVKKELSEKAMKVVGRNEPCPCGSGKKYKLCHGKLS